MKTSSAAVVTLGLFLAAAFLVACSDTDSAGSDAAVRRDGPAKRDVRADKGKPGDQGKPGDKGKPKDKAVADKKTPADIKVIPDKKVVPDAKPSAIKTLWMKLIKGTGTAHLDDIVRGPKGNLHVVGRFSGALTLGASKLSSPSGITIFVAKLSPAGAFLWAVQGVGVDKYNVARGLAVDKAGNVVIAGRFDGQLAFGSHKLTSVGSGGTNLFVARFSAAGKALWAVSTGGIDHDEATDVAVDGAGNAYVTGRIRGAVKFGATTVGGPGTTYLQFLARMSPGGSFGWVRTYGGSSFYDSKPTVGTDAVGNVYLASTLYGSLKLGTHSVTSAGSADVFMAKATPAGVFSWVQAAGGTQKDIAWAMAVDSAGNSRLTGTFFGSATFGKTKLTSAGYGDAFVSALSPAGAITWAASGQGPNSSNIDHGSALAIGAGGDTYVAGKFMDRVTFGGKTLISPGGKWEYELFLARLDSKGKVSSAYWYGGSGYDFATGLTTDPAGNAYVVGNAGSSLKTPTGSHATSYGTAYIWKVYLP